MALPTKRVLPHVLIKSKHSLRDLAPLLLVAVVFLAFAQQWTWGKADGLPINDVISSDGKGYYKYLPSIFIDQNFGLEPEDQRYLFKTPHGVASKYNAGTALAIAPFFGLTYIYHLLKAEAVRGYGPTFQKSVGVAALFYLLLGLFFVSKTLVLFGFGRPTINAVLLLLAFGTGLTIYTLQSPAFSHIYSFCAIAALLYFVKRFARHGDTLSLLLCAGTFGFVLFIRPFNGLILFALPFVLGSRAELNMLLQKALAKPWRLLAGFVLAISLALMQTGVWYYQTGQLMLWGYGGEGFYFDRPAFWQTLFGFRKGLFIYSPLLLLAFACLLPRSPAMIFAKFSFVGFFCLLIYFVSTWWIWYYGPGFGQRVVVDFLPVFAIAMAFGLRAIFVKSAEQSAGHTPYVKAGRVALVALMVALLALNLVQSYQYHVGIISAWDMDSTKYRYTFLKVGDEYRNVLGGNQDMMPYHQEKKVVFQCMADFESPESSFETRDFWQLPGRQNRVSDYRGKEFNTVLRIAIDTSYITGKNLHLSVAFDKYEMAPGQLHEDALFVLALESNKGEQYSHYTFNINEIPIFETGRWESKRYEVEVPIRKAGDVISVYIWNKPKKQLLIDNWEVRLYALR